MGDCPHFRRAATEQDFEAYFRSIRGQDLRSLVKTALQFESNTDEPLRGASERARSALARIGRSSALNRLRVERLGVDVG